MPRDEKLILSYGGRPRSYRYIWRAVLLVAIALIAILSRQYISQLNHWVTVRRAFAHCKSHLPAAHAVAFGGTTSPADPPYWNTIWNELPDPEAGQLRRHGLGRPPSAGPLLFLHSLRDPSGNEHLVAVSLLSTIHHSPLIVHTCVFDGPTSAQEDGVVVRTDGPLDEFERFHPQKIFEGTPDPNDPTHFTFVYQAAEGRGTVDGYLLGHGNVKLSLRDGPALAMHDAMAALKLHPEQIQNHLRVQALAWMRGNWRLPQEYETFVDAHKNTMKGKLWQLLIANQWRRVPRDLEPRDRLVKPPIPDLRDFLRDASPDSHPASTDPLNRLTPQEIALGQKVASNWQTQRILQPAGADDLNYPPNRGLVFTPSTQKSDSWGVIVASPEQLMIWAHQSDHRLRNEPLRELAKRIRLRMIPVSMVRKLAVDGDPDRWRVRGAVGMVRRICGGSRYRRGAGCRLAAVPFQWIPNWACLSAPGHPCDRTVLFDQSLRCSDRSARPLADS